jgi:hypothetical protein
MFTRPYMFILGRITLPDPFLVGLLPTQLYPATLPGFLPQPGNTLLHPTAYPPSPNHAIQLGTLQLTSSENFLISLQPCLRHQNSSGNPKPTRVTLKQPN